MEIKEKISTLYGSQTFFGAVVYGARIFLSCSSDGAGTFFITFCKYFQPRTPNK